MNRRDFVGKAAGVSALAAIGGKVEADVVEPGPEVCKLRHTVEDGPLCIRVKVLSISRVEDIEWDARSGAKWICEYELTRIDDSKVIRTAICYKFDDKKPSNNFAFDLS